MTPAAPASADVAHVPTCKTAIHRRGIAWRSATNCRSTAPDRFITRRSVGRMTFTPHADGRRSTTTTSRTNSAFVNTQLYLDEPTGEPGLDVTTGASLPRRLTPRRPLAATDQTELLDNIPFVAAIDERRDPRSGMATPRVVRSPTRCSTSTSPPEKTRRTTTRSKKRTRRRDDGACGRFWRAGPAVRFYTPPNGPDQNLPAPDDFCGGGTTTAPS